MRSKLIVVFLFCCIFYNANVHAKVTGLYAGVLGGVEYSSLTITQPIALNTDIVKPFDSSTFLGIKNSHAILGGLKAGIAFKLISIGDFAPVLGIEGQYHFANKVTFSRSPANINDFLTTLNARFGGTETAALAASLTQIGSALGKFGIAFKDMWMVYFAGGVAFGSSSVSFTYPQTNDPNNLLYGKDLNIGYQLGGGMVISMNRYVNLGVDIYYKNFSNKYSDILTVGGAVGADSLENMFKIYGGNVFIDFII